MDEPQLPAEPPGRPATRRRLLVGAGALLAAAAVPTGIVVFGGGSDKAKRAAPGARGSTPSPLRTPPPVAIPAHPTLKRLGALKGHHGGVGDFRFSPDGTTLVSSESRGGVLRLWDVAGRRERATSPKIADATGVALAFSPDGRTLATGTDARARFWDAATLRPLGGEIAGSGEDSFETFSAIAFSPDGKSFVASGDSDEAIRFYDSATRRPVGEPLGDSGAGTIVFSPDGSTLASVGASGSDGVRIWDVAARTRRAKAKLDVFGGAQNLVLSPDGTTLAVDNDSGEVRFLTAATGKEHGRPLGGHIGSVTGLAYSTDGHTVVTSDFSGLHFWDATTHKKRATVTLPGTRPTVEHHRGEVALSGPGAMVKMESGGRITVTRPGTRSITGFALSPDGRTVATTGIAATTITLWRLA